MVSPCRFPINNSVGIFLFQDSLRTTSAACLILLPSIPRAVGHTPCSTILRNRYRLCSFVPVMSTYFPPQQFLHCFFDYRIHYRRMRIRSNKYPLKVLNTTKKLDDGLCQAGSSRLEIYTLRLCITVY